MVILQQVHGEQKSLTHTSYARSKTNHITATVTRCPRRALVVDWDLNTKLTNKVSWQQRPGVALYRTDPFPKQPRFLVTSSDHGVGVGGKLGGGGRFSL